MALNPKQRRFVAEYLKDCNGTQAAIRAGYSAKTARVAGPRLLANVAVAAAIKTSQAKAIDKAEVEAVDILREAKTFAHSDIGEAFDEHGALLPLRQMPERVRRAIASIESIEQFDSKGVNIGTLKKVKFWSKDRGIELLGKSIKLWTDRTEHGLSPTLEQLVMSARAK